MLNDNCYMEEQSLITNQLLEAMHSSMDATLVWYQRMEELAQ